MPRKPKDESPPTDESAPVVTSGDVAAEAQSDEPKAPEPITDVGGLLYRDRSVTPRDNSVTEGKANFASVMQALREAAPDVAEEGA